ncbi:MAG: peroxiredoxin [Gammaproteobacteria bacterium]|nr:peroxiredoxin [Gammaproteobacteria bacterium]
MLKVGDRLPDATLKQMTDDGPIDVDINEYCAGKKVVIFALPGAFTPTCSETHVPGYVQHAEAIRSKGIDAIACISTADFFVMGAWAKSMNVGDAVDMLADGNQAFTSAAGMGIDLSGAGLGNRSNRYVMTVENGVITRLMVEPNAGVADVSSAESLLAAL